MALLISRMLLSLKGPPEVKYPPEDVGHLGVVSRQYNLSCRRETALFGVDRVHVHHFV